MPLSQRDKARLRNNRARTFTSSEESMLTIRNKISSLKGPQKDLAEDIGVSPSTINNIFTGKTKWPRPSTLFPLLGALGLSLAFIDGEEDSQSKDITLK